MAANEIDTTDPSSSTESRGPVDLRLLHYNDVYHIEAGSAEPVGGIARFQSVVREYRNDSKYIGQPELLILFSGDAFNPSLESSVTKGRHMVPFLNAIGTNVACVGNHDLDFGVDQFCHLRDQCSFPWLIANVTDPALGDDVPLANCKKVAILTSSGGVKIGVIGLAEREWLSTINSLPPDLHYKSASATAEKLVPGLRAQGCEFIVALTHMREPNDNKLAQKTSDGLIDLILGGHDHYYSHSFIKSTHVLRSGTDFRQLSYIEARKKAGGGWDISIEKRDIVRSIPEDEAFVKLVDKLAPSLKNKFDKPIGYTAAPLDARFTTVRTRESNLANFICDLMRHHYNADCALMAAGTIRGDMVYPPGVIRLKDIMNCFPFEDPVVVIRLTGKALWVALENSVSLVPALDGRFPQVSNIVFEFDPDLPVGARVKWAKVDGESLDMNRKYTMATRGFMTHGKDGFTSLMSISEGGEAEEIVSEENGIILSTMLRQYFLSLKILGRWKRWTGLHRHWNEVHEKLHDHHPVVQPHHDAPSPKKRPRPSANPNGLAEGPDQSWKKIRHQAPVPFGYGGREPTHPSQNEDYHIHGHDMVDSDSDGSVILPHVDRPSISSHPLATAEEDQHPDELLSHDESDRLYHLARTYGKIWMTLAGVDREDVGLVDHHEREHIPSWTHGIAPRVEGRIIRTQDRDE